MEEEVCDDSQQSTSSGRPTRTSKGKAKRKSTDEHQGDVPTASSAVDRALRMQEIEHELQVKRLTKQITFEEEEHRERMKLIQLQQHFIASLHEKTGLVWFIGV